MSKFTTEDIKTEELVVEKIHERVAEILNTDGIEQNAAAAWDQERELAKENGDLQEIAALCIAQLMLEV